MTLTRVSMRKVRKGFTRLCLSAVLMTTAVAQAQTIKLATLAPEGSSFMTGLRQAGRDIAEQTEGRVEVKFYGGGVQGHARQVQRKMRTGQLHGGVFAAGEMAALEPNAFVYALPMLFNDFDEVAFVRGHLDDELRERISEAGYVNFGFAGTGFAYLMSNTPLSSLADLDGKKVWTPEGDQVSFAALQALGIAPVMSPMTDVLTGLQTGLLDSTAVSPVGAVVLQWHTRLKFITDLPVVYTYGAMFIDKRHFERISPEDQAVVRAVFEATFREFDESGMEDNAEAMDALLKSGLAMVPPDAGQVPTWREKVMESHRKQAAKGEFDPALLDRIQALLSEHRSSLASTDQP